MSKIGKTLFFRKKINTQYVKARKLQRPIFFKPKNRALHEVTHC